jgi:hypothetical protein
MTPILEPTRPVELLDITGAWIARIRATVAEIRVPVHARQGEFDRLWTSDAGQVEGFGRAFTSSPAVDAQLAPIAGHCIGFHRAGAAVRLEHLAFALPCSLLRAVTGPAAGLR